MPSVAEPAATRILFDRSQALDAARSLRARLPKPDGTWAISEAPDPAFLLAAELLARAADAEGSVTMSALEMARRSGFSRPKMLKARAELLRAGLVLRPDEGAPLLLQWQPAKLAELAARTDRADRGEQPFRATPESARVYWLEGYRDAKEASPRYGRCGSLQQPAPQNWPPLLEFGDRFPDVATHATIAALTCTGFLRLDDPRLIAEAHPMCFLPGLLDRLAPDVLSALRKKQKPRDPNAPIPSADRQGFSGAQGALNRLNRKQTAPVGSWSDSSFSSARRTA